MTNFDLLLSDPQFTTFGEGNPLSVTAYGGATSPKGRGKCGASHAPWLPLWGSCHGVSRD